MKECKPHKFGIYETLVMIDKETIIPARLSEIWKAWTTTDGAMTFFAPRANIEPWKGGLYEILFDPESPSGQRGAEGLKILEILPESVLAFEWNNPPSIPSIRNEKTKVTIRFEKVDDTHTRVNLEHSGWRTGPDWQKAHQYFEGAWDIVLNRLMKRFTDGPIESV
jgi:uncharacterized protein YndB with AHSA1/START domain